MAALLDVVLPVFLVIGFGYLAAWRNAFSESFVDGLMRFAQNFAIPCLLFRAMASLDLAATFDWRLLTSYFGGALGGFILGTTGARLIFHRSGEDAIAIGFACMFANAVLLGLPITERAWGKEALGPNFGIVSLNAPICYGLGITAMEFLRNRGLGRMRSARAVIIAMFRNAIILAIGLGLAVNLTGLPVPGVLDEAIALVARSALPVALFGLGGVLVRYRPEGDARIVAMVCSVSLALVPAIVWMLAAATGLTLGGTRSAVLTASMAPGVNAYIFANMYDRARRVAASSVLVATAVSIVTVWLWLIALP